MPTDGALRHGVSPLPIVFINIRFDPATARRTRFWKGCQHIMCRLNPALENKVATILEYIQRRAIPGVAANRQKTDTGRSLEGWNQSTCSVARQVGRFLVS